MSVCHGLSRLQSCPVLPLSSLLLDYILLYIDEGRGSMSLACVPYIDTYFSHLDGSDIQSVFILCCVIGCWEVIIPASAHYMLSTCYHMSLVPGNLTMTEEIYHQGQNGAFSLPDTFSQQRDGTLFHWKIWSKKLDEDSEWRLCSPFTSHSQTFLFAELAQGFWTGKLHERPG